MPAYNFKDRTGAKIGRLTVIRLARKDRFSNAVWLCRCDCGSECEVNLNYKTKSCGCLRVDTSRSLNTTHGSSYTLIYNIWHGIKKRCLNPHFSEYPKYGGRGITICKRWEKFENFLYDMGERPPGMSIERKNNSGNYEPENCEWATPKEQARNRRSNHLVQFNGQCLCLAEWAEITGIHRATLWGRLNRGWNIQDALTR